MLCSQIKLLGFSFKIVVVYGFPYEEGKQMFLDELEKVMGSWTGPIMISGDFKLVRSLADKNNGVVNLSGQICLMIGLTGGGFVEIELRNRKFTWTNNQENVVMARIDRVVISTQFDLTFPWLRLKLWIEFQVIKTLY